MKKREFFEAIRELVKDNEEYVAFLNAQIAALDKRNDNAKSKRKEKTQNVADAIQERAVEVLEQAGRAITLAELVAGIGEFTSSQVVYHIRPLVLTGVIVKEKAKIGDRKIMSYKVAE